MKNCRVYGQAIYGCESGDLTDEYHKQADALVIGSLLENQQFSVDNLICEDCYEILD